MLSSRSPFCLLILLCNVDHNCLCRGCHGVKVVADVFVDVDFDVKTDPYLACLFHKKKEEKRKQNISKIIKFKNILKNYCRLSSERGSIIF